MLIVFLSIVVQLCQSSPVLIPDEIRVQNKGSEGCDLPVEYGVYSETKVKFLEDCKSLDKFTNVPQPSVNIIKGVHPLVCCPQYLEPDGICTPTDPWCPTYQEYEYDYGSGYEDYDADADYYGETKPTEFEDVYTTVADKTCAPYSDSTIYNFNGENVTECVTLDRCPSLLENPTERKIFPCGFDEEASLIMVCCPESRVTETKSPEIKPRFPEANGQPRPVEDRTLYCERWKNHGACRLDQIFILDSKTQQQEIASVEMFMFMMSACMKTCDWGKRGCVDEHVNCPKWARLGLCSTGPFFMAHTCRESCGVCGFLNPNNSENQEVGDASYTNIKDSNFDCGRYKNYCEIQEDCTAEDLTQGIDGKPRNVTYKGWGYEDEKTGGCGTTLINDRFAVSAGHCYKDFGTLTQKEGQKLTIRQNSDFEEILEIKRVYTHPLYNNNQLYNDMVVIELGRRVEFDFTKYGHTPTCLDRGDQELDGKIATVQGSGKTETNEDDYRALLETNVTLISNVECQETLQFNSTEDVTVNRTVFSALPFGITYGFVCAKGIENDGGIFSGSCQGDSGGPLMVNLADSNSVDRQTLTGIVSGGVGCGLNIPGWYTKVSTFLPWVNCIIEASRDPEFDEEMVKEKCDKVADCLVPRCINKEELFSEDILGLRAGEDQFNIPVCNSEPTETVADCLSDLGISV